MSPSLGRQIHLPPTTHPLTPPRAAFNFKSFSAVCVLPSQWNNYLCQAGGWGTVTYSQIQALLTVCPCACKDGACHEAPTRPPSHGHPYELVRSNVMCATADVEIGNFDHLNQTSKQACADACSSTWGCEYFEFGRSGARERLCLHVHTSNIDCTEGWVFAPGVDFYQVWNLALL